MRRPLEEDGTKKGAWHGIRYLNPEPGSKDRAACIKALQCPLLRWVSGDLAVDAQVSMIVKAAQESPKVHNYKTSQQARVSKITKHWADVQKEAACEKREGSTTTSIRKKRSRQMEQVQGRQRANTSSALDPPGAPAATGGSRGTSNAAAAGGGTRNAAGGAEVQERANACNANDGPAAAGGAAGTSNATTDSRLSLGLGQA